MGLDPRGVSVQAHVAAVWTIWPLIGVKVDGIVGGNRPSLRAKERIFADTQRGQLANRSVSHYTRQATRQDYPN
jgi:hypothetical protein